MRGRMETNIALFQKFIAFPSPGDVGELEKALGEQRERALDRLKQQEKTRLCLKCDTEFLSGGPDNRLCDSCRKDNQRMTAGVLPCFHGLE